MKVIVEKEIACPVDVKAVETEVSELLREHGVKETAEVVVAIVGREKMRELVSEYLKDGKEHPVLSFPSSEMEGEFKFPPDGVKHLGEVVVSYPWAETEAGKSGVSPENAVCELAKHGTLHLIGVHHN